MDALKRRVHDQRLGYNIWDQADGLQFVEQTLTGDGSITARVASQLVAMTTRKQGVMVRETLEAGSANAAVLLTPTPVPCYRGAPHQAVTPHTCGPVGYGALLGAARPLGQCLHGLHIS